MKLHVLADIHVEFGAFTPPKTGADLIVLAGDVHIGQKGLNWAKEAFKGREVVYVLGNHEYYGKALPKLTDLIKTSAQGSNVHILENDKFVMDNVVFLGCTLWTDFKLLGEPEVGAKLVSERYYDSG
jgi:predicted phosphohydrolase